MRKFILKTLDGMEIDVTSQEYFLTDFEDVSFGSPYTETSEFSFKINIIGQNPTIVYEKLSNLMYFLDLCYGYIFIEYSNNSFSKNLLTKLQTVKYSEMSSEGYLTVNISVIVLGNYYLTDSKIVCNNDVIGYDYPVLAETLEYKIKTVGATITSSMYSYNKDLLVIVYTSRYSSLPGVMHVVCFDRFGNKTDFITDRAEPVALARIPAYKENYSDTDRFLLIYSVEEGMENGPYSYHTALIYKDDMEGFKRDEMYTSDMLETHPLAIYSTLFKGRSNCRCYNGQKIYNAGAPIFMYSDSSYYLGCFYPQSNELTNPEFFLYENNVDFTNTSICTAIFESSSHPLISGNFYFSMKIIPDAATYGGSTYPVVYYSAGPGTSQGGLYNRSSSWTTLDEAERIRPISRFSSMISCELQNYDDTTVDVVATVAFYDPANPSEKPKIFRITLRVRLNNLPSSTPSVSYWGKLSSWDISGLGKPVFPNGSYLENLEPMQSNTYLYNYIPEGGNSFFLNSLAFENIPDSKQYPGPGGIINRTTPTGTFKDVTDGTLNNTNFASIFFESGYGDSAIVTCQDGNYMIDNWDNAPEIQFLPGYPHNTLSFIGDKEVENSFLSINGTKSSGIVTMDIDKTISRFTYLKPGKLVANFSMLKPGDVYFSIVARQADETFHNLKSIKVTINDDEYFKYNVEDYTDELTDLLLIANKYDSDFKGINSTTQAVKYISPDVMDTTAPIKIPYYYNPGAGYDLKVTVEIESKEPDTELLVHLKLFAEIINS